MGQAIYILCLVSCFLSGVDSQFRPTSVEGELASLMTLYDQSLARYEVILADARAKCPACTPDDCADGCIFKSLEKFKERLVRMKTVIMKLTKIACFECPGEYWIDSAVPSDPTLHIWMWWFAGANEPEDYTTLAPTDIPPATAPAMMQPVFKISAPLTRTKRSGVRKGRSVETKYMINKLLGIGRSDARNMLGSKNFYERILSKHQNNGKRFNDLSEALSMSGQTSKKFDDRVISKLQNDGMSFNMQSLIVATDGHMVLEHEYLSHRLNGTPRALVYDEASQSAYVALRRGDNSTELIKMNPYTGIVDKVLKTYPANAEQPVGLAMDDNKVAVLLTNGRISSMEELEIASGRTTFSSDAFEIARRITMDVKGRTVYYTTNIGVIRNNISNGDMDIISNVTDAVGIVFDKKGGDVYYCYRRTLARYSPDSKSVTTQPHVFTNCSDLDYYYDNDGTTMGGTPHILMARDSEREVRDFKVGEDNRMGASRMQYRFTPRGGTSITLLPDPAIKEAMSIQAGLMGVLKAKIPNTMTI